MNSALRSIFAGGNGRLVTGTPDATVLLRGDQAWASCPMILAAGRLATTATGSGFQNLYTLSIPANTLGTTKGFRFDCCIRRTTGAAACTMRATYGGTSFGSVAVGTAASAAFCWRGTIWADNSASAQRGQANLYQGNTSSAASGTTGTAAIDSTAAQNFTIDVDLTTDADVFTIDWVCVEVLET